MLSPNLRAVTEVKFVIRDRATERAYCHKDTQQFMIKPMTEGPIAPLEVLRACLHNVPLCTV